MKAAKKASKGKVEKMCDCGSGMKASECCKE